MKTITRIDDFYEEYRNTTHKVAERLIQELDPKSSEVLVDIGCGDGALTIPLSRRLHECKVIAIDNDPQALHRLEQNVVRLNLRNVEIVHDDAKQLSTVTNGSADYVVSHWLLGVFKQTEDLRKIFAEIQRVLKDGGRTAHSESYPHPASRAQELYMRADTLIFDTKWWEPLECQGMLGDIGFCDMKVELLDFRIKVKPNTAYELLADWETRSTSFIPRVEFSTAKRAEVISRCGWPIQRVGLEFPTEYIIYARKLGEP